MFTNISTPYLLLIFLIFAIGACLGSFLNLVIYRIPLNLSIIHPRSHCPECKKTIPIYGLIPFFGFFLLLKKCAFCKTKISWQYPLIEIFCAFISCLLFINFFNDSDFINLLYSNSFSISAIIPFLTALWLFYTGVVLSAIDIKYRILPDAITLPGIFIGLILSTFNTHIGWLTSLTGIGVGFGGLFLLTKLYELVRKCQGMGFGDVKYLAFIGAVVGPLGVFYTLFLASILGSMVGIIYGIKMKTGLKSSIPFGPFLAISALLIYLFQLKILWN